jgi:ADP-L-glycero-D-manno-heptose 6-epimerase
MITITGAAGFIGSNLAQRLAGTGAELLLVDHEPTPLKWTNFSGLTRFQFVRHDLFLELLERDTWPLEGVFHLGACSTTTETNWDYLYKNNVVYSQKLWQWCTRASCPFIYASSAATYGDGTQGFDDRISPRQLRPLNLYGKSKNDFDQWALEEAQAGRQPPGWAGLKFFNVFGPREQHKGRMASVVRQALGQIKEGGEVKLFKSNHPDFPNGGQQRDFIYVEDCMDHMLWLWRNPACGIFNSGTGIARTFLDLALAVFAALGRQPSIRFIDMPGELARQYQNFTRAEMSKLRLAGWTGTPTSLEEGVKRYVEAVRELC